MPLSDELIYLNHAAVAPWPDVTAEAIKRFAAENASRGATDYPRWLKTEQQLRQRLTELINAESPAQIALVKNTSEALSFIASGLDWQAGDNIVGIAQEFPSNRLVWDSLAAQGVEFRQLDLDAHAGDPEQALFDLCDGRTRLISISAVQYARGTRMDLERIGRFAEQQDILYCIDAIQQVGMLQFDVQRYRADFACADGHKWMLGPEGLGLFYLKAERIAQLRPSQFGWHMVEDMSDYQRMQLQPASSARRFECGSPNMLGIHGLNASIGYLLEAGMTGVEQAILQRAQYIAERVERAGFELMSAAAPRGNAFDRRSGIVSFRVPNADQAALHSRLMQAGVICAPRGGGIRFSPHHYTSEQQIDTAFERLTNCL